MSGLFEIDALKESEETPLAFERADADVLIRMLYYCSEEPKLDTQIMSHCQIDRSQLVRFSGHCIRRRLLKFSPSEEGLLCFVATEHGKEVLSKAHDIMDGLGIKLEHP